MTLRPKTLTGIMLAVSLALLPGTWQHAQYYGDAVWLQAGFCILITLLMETLCLRLNGCPLQKHLGNLSWLVCGLLLARALPLMTPFWLLTLASFTAVAITKYGCGGLGKNRLNPVMVGLGLVSICFYQLLPANTAALQPWISNLSLTDALALQTQFDTTRLTADGATAATPLAGDHLNQPAPWQLWSGYLASGLVLAFMRVIRLEIPLAMLASTSTLCYLQGHGLQEALHNLTLGGLIFAAFFIATDPVTSPDSRFGRILFGVLIGAITELVRSFGLYVDGLCFAILAANLLVPQINTLSHKLHRPWYGRLTP